MNILNINKDMFTGDVFERHHMAKGWEDFCSLPVHTCYALGEVHYISLDVSTFKHFTTNFGVFCVNFLKDELKHLWT